jgi:hypothetical protein
VLLDAEEAVSAFLESGFEPFESFESLESFDSLASRALLRVP